jgi:DNA end-binding protein Ku
MWKGVVSFGMVSIPVRLYNATESTAKVSFRQLCPEHRSPITYKRWCAEGDHEVTYGDILKGYEVGKDRYVIIDDKDLDNLPLATAHSIDIEEFVPADDIEPGLYFKNAYYMEPEEAVPAPAQGPRGDGPHGHSEDRASRSRAPGRAACDRPWPPHEHVELA